MSVHIDVECRNLPAGAYTLKISRQTSPMDNVYLEPLGHPADVLTVHTLPANTEAIQAALDVAYQVARNEGYTLLLLTLTAHEYSPGLIPLLLKNGWVRLDKARYKSMINGTPVDIWLRKIGG